MSATGGWVQGALSVLLIALVLASGWREMLALWKRKVLGRMPEVEPPAVVAKRIRRLAGIYLLMLIVSFAMVANILLVLGAKTDPVGLLVYGFIAWHSRKMLSAMVSASKRIKG